MKKLDRRSFLTGAAKSAGAALALGMLPPSIARALAVRAYLVDIGVKSSKVDFGTFAYLQGAGGNPTEYVDIVAP